MPISDKPDATLPLRVTAAQFDVHGRLVERALWLLDHMQSVQQADILALIPAWLAATAHEECERCDAVIPARG